MQQGFEIAVAHEGDAATVTCSGEIDSAIDARLARTIGQAMAPDLRTLHIDLAGVTFLDSSGLRTLVVAATQCEALGIGFSLTTSPWVDRLLNVAGMVDLVHGRLPKRPGYRDR
jgi:anti-sigma B factor antagonist